MKLLPVYFLAAFLFATTFYGCIKHTAQEESMPRKFPTYGDFCPEKNRKLCK